MLRTIFLITLLWSSSLGDVAESQQAPGEHEQHGDHSVELSLGNIKPLDAILQIAKENRIPLGIVFGTKSLLCSGDRPIKIHAKNFVEALSQAVADTGYTISTTGQAYVLMAPDATAYEEKILNYRFDRFSATDSTMNDAGQLLAGYIKTEIDGAQGFATSSHIGPSSKTFTIKMQSATTKEIANRIVSQDGKGVWILHPVDESVAHVGQPSIRILAYGEDATELDRISCEAAPSENM